MRYTTFGSTLRSMTPESRSNRAATTDATDPTGTTDGTRVATRRRRRFLGVGLALATALVGTVVAGSPAPAEAAATRNTTILLVHGFDGGGLGDVPLDSKVNCNDATMTAWKRALKRTFTTVLTVGYYKNDIHCDLSVPGIRNNTVGTDLTEIGKEFAQLVFDEFTSQGVTVAISAHSLGGIVVRQAIAGVEGRTTGFPSQIRVSDVVTSGSAHQGARAVLFCSTPIGMVAPLQCRQMAPLSDYLRRLPANPQGRLGTQWSLFGSACDLVASPESATGMSRNGTSRPRVGTHVFPAPGLLQGGCLGSAAISHGELVTKKAATDRIIQSLLS